MGQNLGPLNIKDTYQDLVQTSGSVFTDGAGNVITNVNITASYATNAGTASTAGQAGSAATAVSASHAIVADSAISANTATSASQAANAVSAESAIIAASAISASHALVADAVSGTIENAVSASYVLGSGVDGAVALATSASHADNADTATFATSAATASIATSALLATSASHAVQADNATTADSATSASYATTASYAENAIGWDGQFSGSAGITGSLDITDTLSVNLVDMGSRLRWENGEDFRIALLSAGGEIEKGLGVKGASNVIFSANTGVSTDDAGAIENLRVFGGQNILQISAEELLRIKGNTQITGSLDVSAGVTGSNALISNNLAIGGIPNVSQSIADAAASGGGGSIDTGSLLEDATVVDATLTFTQGDGTTFDRTINNVASASRAVLADTATSAITADTAGEVNVAADGANATRYVSFTDTTTGTDYQRVDGGLTYNPFTNTLSTATFDGALNGNASSADVATSASHAINADSAATATSATTATSASHALVADTALNVPAVNTGSLMETGSVSNATLTFTKADASTFDLTINNVVNATTATTATTASYVLGSNVDGAVALATTASHALVADTALNVPSVDTGSLMATGSVSGNVLTFTKADATTFNLTVDTGSAATIDTGSFVKNDADIYVSTPKIEEVVTLTQAEYNGITPDANTLYVISDNTGSLVVSASHALVADALSGPIDPFPYTGDAEITGSLLVSGSVDFRGSVDLNNRSIELSPSGSPIDNVLIGPGAGESLTSGVRNICIGGEIFGEGAGEAITTGQQNILIGAGAGRSLVSNSNNVFIGTNTGWSSNSSTGTTTIGDAAGRDHTNVTDGVMVGKWSGYGAQGTGITLLGAKSGWKNRGNYNIWIGYDVVGQNASANFTNSYYLGIGSNVEGADNLIYGYHGTDTTAGDRFLQVKGLINAGQYTSDPTGAGVQAGSIYFNTTTNKLKCYDGTSWNDLF